MKEFSSLDRHLRNNRESQLNLLFELLRLPSISADPAFAEPLQSAADWLSARFSAMGLATRQIAGQGPPLVYAETPAVAGAPVALVYGHYDVQPPDPLSLWESPPFEPTIRDGKVYARGATDDKGQMLTHVLAIESMLACGVELPLQVKFLIEGQEESGSEVLEAKLPELTELLACDVMVISDSSQYAPGQPAVTYGLRGIAYFELHVRGPKSDLHSGVFGGAVVNPAIALCQILAAIKDERGRIQLPGFYDAVLPMSESERAAWRGLGFDDAKFAAQVGVTALAGEADYSTLERRWARPSFDVHGLTSGYQGEGGKTVLPATASAKLSFRLVPNQTPGEVATQFRDFIAANTPAGVTAEVVDLHGGPGIVVDPNSPYLRAASRAVEEAFGVAPVAIREGGSIPIVAEMVRRLGCEAILLGWGLDDDGAHGPNEKFSLDDFYRGIAASSRLWPYLAKAHSM